MSGRRLRYRRRPGTAFLGPPAGDRLAGMLGQILKPDKPLLVELLQVAALLVIQIMEGLLLLVGAVQVFFEALKVDRVGR